LVSLESEKEHARLELTGRLSPATNEHERRIQHEDMEKPILWPTNHHPPRLGADGDDSLVVAEARQIVWRLRKTYLDE